jgi:hypothetical protein
MNFILFFMKFINTSVNFILMSINSHLTVSNSQS